jgi:hypothetical protein
MWNFARRHQRGLTVGAVVLLAVAASALFTHAGNGKGQPQALPPQSHPHGISYGDWSARWWQWCYSLPVDQHPLFDTADCSAGQSGPVWFLGGTFTVIDENPDDPLVEGIAERDCTIPVGTSLFFPILNVECSTIEGNGETEAELRDCAVLNADHIVPGSLVCTIDGVAVQNLSTFRVESPLFEIGPLPDNNILESFGLDAPEGSTSPAVGDGVYVMIPPLPVGKHTLHFEGAAVYTTAADGFDLMFILDITYHITVAR